MTFLGDGRLVMITTPEILKEFFQMESQTPHRGIVLEPYAAWKTSRPEMFKNSRGFFSEEGERWKNIRLPFQRDLMRPRSAMHYSGKLEEITKEFAEHIRQLSSQNPTRAMPDDFVFELNKFAFEAITLIALNTRIHCFGKGASEESMELVKAIDTANDEIGKMTFQIPVWKIAPQFDPSYRRMEKCLDFFSQFIQRRIKETRKEIESSQESDVPYDERPLLQKLIEKFGPESSIPFAAVYDLIQAGVDTTANQLAFILYNLATNPDKQEILSQEIRQHGEELNHKSIHRMKYLKAVIKETHRLNQVVTGNFRLIPNDIVLNSFLIPKNTTIFWPNNVLMTNETIFHQPEK